MVQGMDDKRGLRDTAAASGNVKQYTLLPTLRRRDGEVSTVDHAVQQDVSIQYRVTPQVALSAWASCLSVFTASDEVTLDVILKEVDDQSSKETKRFLLEVDSLFSHEPDDILQQTKESLQRHGFPNNLLENQDSKSGGEKEEAYRTTLEVSLPNHSSRSILNGHLGKDRDAPSKVSFDFLQTSTNITISFHPDLYSHLYIGELLRYTVKFINGFHGKNDSFDEVTSPTLVESWTKPCEPCAKEPLLHTEIEKYSRLHPNSIAIGESERVMTYKELNAGADMLADHLMSLNADAGTIQNVGIYFEKSVYAILAMLAVLKAGGAYVPLDVAWPEARVRTVIEDARIDTVICSETQKPRLQNERLQILTVDAQYIYDLKTSSKSTGPERRKVQPSDPAYMLYTSGSTAKPKGIIVSHSAITASIQAMARELGINAMTRTCQYTTFTFDLSVADIWMTLTCGGRICLPTEDERQQIADFITQERCNYAMITPTAALTIDKTTLHNNIETLALIGESVPERLLRRIATTDASMKVYNTWGPTEASVIASRSECITLDSDLSPSLDHDNIGYPVGCSMFIVSADNPHKLAPAFAPGEIALAGHTLATGYWQNSAQTKQAFRRDLEWTRSKSIQEKVGDKALEVVYLTGDIARYNPNGDGSIIFMHRKGDGYLKINGYRVEPGEVESRVSKLAQEISLGDHVCVVSHTIPDNSANTSQALVCFIVTDHSSLSRAEWKMIEPTADLKSAFKQITSQLSEALPEYMIPRLFIPLTGMPVLTSHKIDKKSLLAELDCHAWRDLVARYGT